MQGVNEVLLKACSLTVIQITIIRYSSQLVIPVLWWIFKKPTSVSVISGINPNSETGTEIEPDTVSFGSWYGDKSVKVVYG